MNYRIVAKFLGHFTLAIALLMLPSAAWAVYFREWQSLAAIFGSMALGGGIAYGLMRLGRNAPSQMFQREGLALVAIGWLLTAFIGSLPYITSGTLGPIDAYFESMSGFTTTGSTVLRDIEATDQSLLFWRSFTQWLGGMGIIVLFIAVLPYLGAGGKQLFKSESPGPDPRGLSPRIKDTASTLYKIYFGLTVILTALLMLAGMGFYDALCHTFATISTGGFSTKQASVGHFDSLTIEVIIIMFMVIGGTNFGLYFAMMRKTWKAPLADTEFKAYVLILSAATLLITLNLLGVQGHSGLGTAPPTADYSPGGALRTASFQVVSVMTTTGYGTDDFDTWPEFSRVALLMLMFVGGCAGSTSGGFKVVRGLMLLKMAYWRLEHTFRPKTVRAIRISGHVVGDDVQKTVYGLFVLYVTVFALGSAFMAFLGLPFQTAVSSVIATLNNIGPGLEFVGQSRDFADIPAVGKLFLSLCMVMGRLELFSVCVLFIPAFWKQG